MDESMVVDPGVGGGGYYGFQVTGMIKGFLLGLKFSIPNLASILCVCVVRFK